MNRFWFKRLKFLVVCIAIAWVFLLLRQTTFFDETDALPRLAPALVQFKDDNDAFVKNKLNSKNKKITVMAEKLEGFLSEFTSRDDHVEDDELLKVPEQYKISSLISDSNPIANNALFFKELQESATTLQVKPAVNNSILKSRLNKLENEQPLDMKIVGEKVKTEKQKQYALANISNANKDYFREVPFHSSNQSNFNIHQLSTEKNVNISDKKNLYYSEGHLKETENHLSENESKINFSNVGQNELGEAKEANSPHNTTFLNSTSTYEPVWQSLDRRPLPQWYDQAKFGIFIHWGVYSVPGYVSEKFWWKWKGTDPDASVVNFMKRHYPPNYSYEDFARNFNAEFFNATEWALLFQESGAQYVVLTSKHHDGYSLWPSEWSKNWNSGEVGPNMDIVGLLVEAIRAVTTLKFGLYYSLLEWFNKLYIEDRENQFRSSKYVDAKALPELHYLVNHYFPDVIWADGDFGSSSYWKSKEFLAWLYNESKVKDTVVSNDRWGDVTHCKHGGFLLCSQTDQQSDVKRKWEKLASLDKLSWGYRRNVTIDQFLTIQEVISLLVSTVSRGGNFLLNIGPSKEGIIPPIFQERLRQLGSWLQKNGEGIYSSQPWRVSNDNLTSSIWYTSRDQIIYAFMFPPAKNGTIEMSSPIGSQISKVTLLGWNDVGLPWNFLNGAGRNGIKVRLPRACWTSGFCKWTVTLKLINFK